MKNGLIILYLIDMFTRYTLAQLVSSKDPANEKYKDMCENLNIQVLNRAGKIPLAKWLM